MKISISWLRELVPFDLSPDELADTLTMLGLEAVVDRPKGEFEGVVIGQVVAVAPVPDSDHLSLCQVETGHEMVSIICGAPNVAAGQKVPVATVGAVLPGGIKIKQAKIRGQVSQGMICAEDELGLSGDHSGIMVLPDDAVVGTDFRAYLAGSRDATLDLDLTPNRGDAFSHLGVARDIAAKLGTQVKLPEITFKEDGPAVEELASVAISSPDGCHRYAARVITGIKVAPSPEWLASRMAAVGMRSINNVVDASNFVMMEMGQPLHIFDYDQLADHAIDVTFADQGARFTTLDGTERELGKHHLLIADGKGAIALAGIMGGLNSEVTDGTTSILIESAYFAPAVIRKGAKSLELSSEASKRFERDIDIDGVIVALDRVTQIISDVAGGTVARGRIDIYPVKHEEQTVSLSTAFTNRLSGLDLSRKDIAAALERLGIRTKVGRGADLLDCAIPLNRPELTMDVDLIEEVTRLTGYDTIPPVSGIDIHFDGLIPDRLAYLEPIRQALVHWGFYEHYAITLTGADETTMFADGDPVLITNPLGIEMSRLRTSLLPGLLEAAAFNGHRQQQRVNLFEIGGIHRADGTAYNLDRESLQLGLIQTLGETDIHWKKHPDIDLFALKGVVSQLLLDAGVGEVRYQPVDSRGFDQALEILSGKTSLGVLGTVARSLCERFDLEMEAAAAEIDLDTLSQLAGDDEMEYQPVAPYPIVERDLALELPIATPAGDLLDTIRATGGKYLRDVRLFDLYSGDKIAEGQKSLAFRLYLQSREGTLTDKQIDKQIENIAGQLEKNHGARWRRT